MIKVYNYEDWDKWDGASEGSGRSEKIWLTNKNTNEIGLFKFPKSSETTEHISEKLAKDIADLLSVSCARVEIGTRDKRIGCMSYLINIEGSQLIEGVNFISAKRIGFNKDTLYDSINNEYYSLDMIETTLETFFKKGQFEKVKRSLYKMILFDALIGNSDRHQSNWAFIVDKDRNVAYLSPLYDNGSSLCAYETEEKIDSFLGNDKVKFDSLVDSKSRSKIRIAKYAKKEPSYREILLYLKRNCYEFSIDFAKVICEKINGDNLDLILASYPESMFSTKKKQLVKKFLLKKREIICTIYEL